MPMRYSGLVKVRVTYVEERAPAHPRGARPGHYRCYLSTPTTLRGKGRTIIVGECSLGHDGYPYKAVDSSEAYDAAARSAVAQQAWADLFSDFSDFGAREWTGRPSYEQCAWTTADGAPPTPGPLIDRGIDTGRADIVVHRSRRECGAWLADHPRARK